MNIDKKICLKINKSQVLYLNLRRIFFKLILWLIVTLTKIFPLLNRHKKMNLLQILSWQFFAVLALAILQDISGYLFLILVFHFYVEKRIK